ncbi:MAG: gamma-glutamyltransferase family protein [Rhodobacteraceae bacterium]|nr:gamma-glutamyltransferase family protein [Paracoccaceae bacterium]
MRDFQLPGRSAVFASNGMCATSHPLAARSAVRILEDGGNAVDAAIAAAVLLGICEPQSTGMGGDCFALVKLPNDGRIIGLNGSGRAPAKACADNLRDRGHRIIEEFGVDAITVPGAIDAFCRLSEDYGRLSLGQVLQPAIHYAEEGVPVSPRVARDWPAASEKLRGSARKHYLLDGKAPVAGDTVRFPGQAEVLRRVARNGRDGFYMGEVAEDMIASLQALGGLHTVEDFATTRCEYTEPISANYRGIDLVEHPPNGQGAAAIVLANILEQFNLTALEPFGVERTHIEVEAAKLAIDARDRFISDPESCDRLPHLLDKEVGKDLASLIEHDKVLEKPHEATEAIHRDTVYLTVVDRDLMMVSMIYSIFSGFGSGLASEKFGVNFHNRGAGFNLIPGHPNELEAGKRPMHTIIPAMLREGDRVFMSFGVMGAHYQAIGHARFLTNMMDFGFDPQAALDGPRSFPELGETQLERGYSDAVRRGLSDIGHNVTTPDAPLGGGQAIKIDHERGTLIGASDPRKDGCALGY